MSLLRFHIDQQLEQLEAQRQVVDARLTRPARWRGGIRSPIEGRLGNHRRRQVAREFDKLAAVGESLGDLSVDAVVRMNAGIGGDGAFRTGGARIGEFRIHHRSSEVSALVEAAVGRANDGFEPPALASARLHMELTLIHPFRDGNGRASRLAAGWVLLRAGYRSTLFTAVEQHAGVVRGSYFRSFRLLHTSQPTQYSEWLRTALIHQIEGSKYVFEYRAQESAMRGTLKSAGVANRYHDLALASHESGRPSPYSPLLRGFEAWSERAESMSGPERGRARDQIGRLLREERSVRP